MKAQEVLMNRCPPLFAAGMLLAATPALRADAFDRYTNPVLARAPGAEGVQELKQLTPDVIADHDHILPDAAGALVIVKTNEGRYSKLLVQPARQKVKDKAVPILLIDRYVTYKEGEERTVQASGQNVRLFDGFLFSLDVGQVVPAELGGDLRVRVEKGDLVIEPVGKARLYVIAKPLPGAQPKKTEKVVIGESFEPRYFNGTYKLYDDGRRSGTLTLQVDKDGDVTGSYFSDKDGRKYEVDGRIGTPRHNIQFTIKYPRTAQVFQGWLFTGDGRALTGSSRLLDRETGFYAVRVEQE
jgi:hypothetical protein